MPSPNGPSSDGIISGINVTPLVDVMLVLLVIFIVTAKVIVTPAVPLDLPHAAHAEDVQVIFSIIVPAHGPVLVNGAALPSDEALSEKARAAAAVDPELRAVIQADGDVPHRRVIHILDELKGAGVTRVAFGALPDETPTPSP